MQFPTGNANAGEIPHRQWFPDERDGFISWLRGEFAAANAMIDSLCHHLRAVGEPGEYDAVIASIQQRRCNWNPVLHMQQYFSVADVMFALQQVFWRRQQRFYDPVKMGNKDFKRSGMGFKQGHRNGHNSAAESHSFDGNSFSGNAGSEKGGSDKSGDEAGNSDDKASLPAAEETKGNLFFYLLLV